MQRRVIACSQQPPCHRCSTGSSNASPPLYDSLMPTPSTRDLHKQNSAAQLRPTQESHSKTEMHHLDSLQNCIVGSGTGVIENNVSTARSTFARAWVNAHTDARTRFVIADRPQTIVWAFTLSSRTSIWRFMAI